VFGDDQPSFADEMTPQTRAVMPTVDRIAPGMSALRAGPRDSGMIARAAMMPRIAIGMFSRNTEPHQKCSSRSPPRVGPPNAPSISTELQMAMAFLRSSSSKTVVRIDRVPGIRKAPPMPIRPRAAMSWPGVWQTVARMLAPPNTTSPVTRPSRRPCRSDRLPAVSRRPANTRM
jgi:hypothetical protein